MAFGHCPSLWDRGCLCTAPGGVGLGLADAFVLAPTGARGAVSPRKPSGFLMCTGRGSRVPEGLHRSCPLLAAVPQRTVVVPSVPPSVPVMALSPISAPLSCSGARTAPAPPMPGMEEKPPPHRPGKGVRFRQILQRWDVRSSPARVFPGVLVGISPSLLLQFPCPVGHSWGAAVRRLAPP